MSEMKEETQFEVEEHVVLEKYEGDPVPENIAEKVIIINGEVVQHDFYEQGEVVASYDSLQGGDELNATN